MEKPTDNLVTEEKEMMIASQLMLRGDFVESESYFLKAINKLKAQKSSNISFALSIDGLGQLYLRRNMLNEAKNKFEETLEIYENHFPEFKVGLFLTLINLASVLELQNALEQSADRLEQAMKVTNDFQGDNEKNLIEILMENYTRVLEKLGKYDESEKFQKDFGNSTDFTKS